MPESFLKDRNSRARIAALWIMNGTASARLLRATGQTTHADNLEAAYAELTEILARELGRDALARAMDWASGAVWDPDSETPDSRH